MDWKERIFGFFKGRFDSLEEGRRRTSHGDDTLRGKSLGKGIEGVGDDEEGGGIEGVFLWCFLESWAWGRCRDWMGEGGIIVQGVT